VAEPKPGVKPAAAVIAALARVAPATVYAVAGGKHGLLRTLIESWMTAPAIAATLKRIEELDNPDEILRVTAAACRTMQEEFGDNHPRHAGDRPARYGGGKRAGIGNCNLSKSIPANQPAPVKSWGSATRCERRSCRRCFWFYFGYWSIFTLHDDNRWTYERAEKWLCDQATRALIGATANAGAKG
jgi:hypothetical protein